MKNSTLKDRARISVLRARAGEGDVRLFFEERDNYRRALEQKIKSLEGKYVYTKMVVYQSGRIQSMDDFYGFCNNQRLKNYVHIEDEGKNVYYNSRDELELYVGEIGKWSPDTGDGCLMISNGVIDADFYSLGAITSIQAIKITQANFTSTALELAIRWGHKKKDILKPSSFYLGNVTATHGNKPTNEAQQLRQFIQSLEQRIIKEG